MEKDDPRRVRLGPLKPGSNNKFIVQAEGQLKAYFSGKLKKFTVPLDFKGTDFQESVWKALLTIPFGETRSYGEIARTDSPARRLACGRRSQRPQSNLDHHTLPSRARGQWQTDRLCGRVGSQGSIAQARRPACLVSLAEASEGSKISRDG